MLGKHVERGIFPPLGRGARASLWNNAELGLVIRMEAAEEGKPIRWPKPIMVESTILPATHVPGSCISGAVRLGANDR